MLPMRIREDGRRLDVGKELDTTIRPVMIHKVLRGAHIRIRVETRGSVGVAVYQINFCALWPRCVLALAGAVTFFFAVLHFFLTSA